MLTKDHQAQTDLQSSITIQEDGKERSELDSEFENFNLVTLNGMLVHCQGVASCMN